MSQRNSKVSFLKAKLGRGLKRDDPGCQVPFLLNHIISSKARRLRNNKKTLDWTDHLVILKRQVWHARDENLNTEDYEVGLGRTDLEAIIVGFSF